MAWHTHFYNVSVSQDDENNWWLEYYVDDIRHGVSLDEIHAVQQLLALDGGDSAASKQLSTPEVLSTLQGESTPAHRK